MTAHPEYTVQGLLQAIDEAEPFAEWIRRRARELTAATPAPDAAGDAVRALEIRRSMDSAMNAELCRQIIAVQAVVAKWRRNGPISDWYVSQIEAALANPPQSAGAGDGVEGEGV